MTYFGLNRKNINDIIKILPWNSEILGAPRNRASMHDYVKTFPSWGRIELQDEMSFEKDIADLPVFFRTQDFCQRYSPFVAQLYNGRIWGCNGAVIGKGDYFISDVSREFNKGMNIDHSIYYTLKQVKSRYLKGNTAVIGTAGANIYYHWMMDVLPRLSILSRIISLDEIDYFVTQYDGLPFQQETLEKAGIPSKKILASNGRLNFHVKAENLYVPSFAGPLDQPGSFQVNYLRTLFADHMGNKTPYRNIYISREKTGRRQIINEEELLHYLSLYEFEKFHTEEMTVAEQASLFSSAKIIVCSHGSALTNLAFCMRGTSVLDIFNTSHINSCFWFLSRVNLLNYQYMCGTPVSIDGNPKNDHTKVDLEAFKMILRNIGLDEKEKYAKKRQN